MSLMMLFTIPIQLHLSETSLNTYLGDLYSLNSYIIFNTWQRIFAYRVVLHRYLNIAKLNTNLYHLYT